MGPDSEGRTNFVSFYTDLELFYPCFVVYSGELVMRNVVSVFCYLGVISSLCVSAGN